jgi:hypothetical protein
MADGDVCAYKIRSVRQIRAFSQESAQGIFPIGRISAPRVLAGVVVHPCTPSKIDLYSS